LKTPPIDREPDLEELFVAERALVPYRDEIRQRAFARAKLATPPVTAPVATTPTRSLGRGQWFVGTGVALGIASVGAALFVIRHRPGHLSETAPQPTGAAPEVTAPDIVRGTLSDSQEPSPRSRGTVQAEEYARELRILEPARRAFARGDMPAVLQAAEEHERMFPHGGLAEERDALRVRALFRQHRDDEARRAAAAFRKRFPHSVLLDEIGK
jgi:hypothetical protein